MNWPKVKSVLEISNVDSSIKRRLDNELRELDTIKRRKERNMTRVQMGVRNDLYRLKEDKHRLQTEKQHAESPAARRLKAYICVPFAAAIIAANSTNHAKPTQNKERRLSSIQKTSAVLKPKDVERDLKPHSSFTHTKMPSLLPKLSASKGAGNALKIPEHCSPDRSRPLAMISRGRPTLVSDSLNSNTAADGTENLKVGGWRERRQSAVNQIEAEAHRNSLIQFLDKQRTTVDDISTGCCLTEDVVAMRNMGKSNEQIWNDLKNCRYLRGHEPAEHRLIDRLGPSKYVYGLDYEQKYNELLARVAQEIEETKQRRQAEADATIYRLPRDPSEVEEKLASSSIDLEQYKFYMKRFF